VRSTLNDSASTNTTHKRAQHQPTAEKAKVDVLVFLSSITKPTRLFQRSPIDQSQHSKLKPGKWENSKFPFLCEDRRIFARV